MGVGVKGQGACQEKSVSVRSSLHTVRKYSQPVRYLYRNAVLVRCNELCQALHMSCG